LARNWDVQFSPEAVRLFEASVPRQFRSQILKAALGKLATDPNKPGKSRKRLSAGRPPYFHGKDVWQCRVQDWRFFYVLEENRIVVFFVGRKGRKTTEEMVQEYE